jgi:hypothetical protein
MSDTDEVNKSLNYLIGFKAEMTSDKKHHTEVLIKEVKRLRALLEETNQHLDLMVERFGIEALVEMVGEQE